MPLKHINENFKKESGVILSGEDANKVFSIFGDKKTEEQVNKKRMNLKSIFLYIKKVS